MTNYSVKQVSQLAGVSVRTLHHYDKIGLLKPAVRTESKYRYYDRDNLFKLQQILFYKELGFTLEQIIEILEDEDFDVMQALEFQRQELQKKAGSIKQLIKTLDKTIVELKTGKKMNEEEIYDGFSKEETHNMRNKVKEKYGEKALHDSEDRISKLDKKQWAAVKDQGEGVAKKLGTLLHLDPSSKEVQAVVKEHFHWLENFYEVPRDRYLGLSQLYVQDERFKAYYDKYGEGVAVLLSKGMEIFAARNLK